MNEKPSIVIVDDSSTEKAPCIAVSGSHNIGDKPSVATSGSRSDTARPSIVIADESALYLHLHTNGPQHYGATSTRINPLAESATVAPDSSSFNPDHPLYGGAPVSLLVGSDRAKRRSHLATCRSCTAELPLGSFYKLRDHIFATSPELSYARMGNHYDEFRLAEVGMNLCGRFYLDLDTGKTEDRTDFLTTPEKLKRYLDDSLPLRGYSRARSALRWIAPNSGSPEETKMKLQFCAPFWAGGLALPFTHMNYDVQAGRLAYLTKQNEFCIDLVNPELKSGMEYDGEDSHLDPSKDKRRINELRALGWNLFPIDKSILFNPDATIKMGLLIRNNLGLRHRFPKSWENNFVMLRDSLGLPI